ncbi:MAG TPA: LptA/OstA family protein [Magnetospirillaceae bacterium]|jgi:lipopolysaccharide export system protein LptA
MYRPISFVALTLLIAAGGARLAAAQAIDFATQPGVPVEVYADNGLELSQDAKTVIAHGNARAVRGRVTVTADTLIAHYREKTGAAAAAPLKSGTADAVKAAATPAAAKPGEKNSTDPTDMQGSSEVWRLEANGHVHIFTETQNAYGDHADYNIDDAVAVLTGKNLRMVTAKETVTARDSLEYWENRQQAVARGKAVATEADKHIQGDVLVADYGQNAQKQTVMRHATGFGNVIMTTPNEIVKGDRADYDPLGGVVTVTGAVKLTRGENQLDGGYAVVDLNTGVSHLFPNAPGTAANSDNRVKGLLMPSKKAGDTVPGTGAPKLAAPQSDDAPPPPVKTP